MSYSKFIAIVLSAAVSAAVFAADAGAQSRGRSGGGPPSAGQAVPRSEGSPRQAPRAQGPRHDGSHAEPYRGDGRYDSRGYAGRGYRAPLRSYYYPSYYGYGYGYRGYRPGFSIGLGLGDPYYYGGYGYPSYGSYGYSYGGYYPRGYAYRGAYAGRYDDYGGIRIQGAPRNAEVYVDGAYAGIVDDYDGIFQRLDLEPGPHEVEIRTAGRPLVYDVNVTLRQTVTIHANIR